MSTLLLRLAGPLQAWGSSSKFNTRYTDREPTKSGVIGMIASAMGRSRDESVEDLNNLIFGVRVDQEGEFQKDFHTAKGKESFVTHRHYISDALFIVGLEGKEDILLEIELALKSPAYPLFLGRRSCPPTMPIVLGIRSVSLRDALRNEPWNAGDWYKKKRETKEDLRIVCDAGVFDENGVVNKDCPISFSQTHRKHGIRYVVNDILVTVDNPSSKKQKNGNSTDNHNPIAELNEFNRRH